MLPRPKRRAHGVLGHNPKRMENSRQPLETARAVMEIEAGAIARAAARLDGNLTRAVELILARPERKLVVTGIGKSGHVGRKIVATLRSTGSPAVFLHPAEAVHGDLGVYAPGDPTLMISKSGTTAELLRLLPRLRELDSPSIGILGRPCSPLGKGMDVVLDATVEREADRHDLVPTASAIVALALGDALAMALSEARAFTVEEFGQRHPGGQIGRNLRSRVREVMHAAGAVAWARPGDPLKQVVILMTAHPLGAACVVDEEGRLAGLITDGDLRRALQAHDDIRPLRAADVMTRAPIAIGPDALLIDALRLMENRPSQISVLPVTEAGGRCLGVIRIHDLYQPGA